MGECFSNFGLFMFIVNYVSSFGYIVQCVQVFQGVLGSNSMVSMFLEMVIIIIMFSVGDYFYYVKIIQDDGLCLWLVLVWVIEGFGGGGGGDIILFMVSVLESGISGIIILLVSVSDNVGVSKVEFYVDGVFKVIDIVLLYSVSFDFIMLVDGLYSLVVKVYDVVGNVGISSMVSFSVFNGLGGGLGGGSIELIGNGGFESGVMVWMQISGVINSDISEVVYVGSWKVWLDGYGLVYIDYVCQSVVIFVLVVLVMLSFYLYVDIVEFGSIVYDKFFVQVIMFIGKYIMFVIYFNVNVFSGYVLCMIDLGVYKGQMVQVNFYGVEDGLLQILFVIDDVSVKMQ